ncbi:MAG TPA: molybdopterin biosynthesis protein MoeB, partial [Idiomarina abyssalis]|nr:molybdopterin biosynthesis protein MoeB [Idiomarina abyssalis]
PLNCSNAGIAAPVVGIMGSSQALQAINYFTGHKLAWGYLHTFNGLSQNWQQLYLPRAASCPVCGGQNAHSN